MKKAILLISIITLFFVGCKKDDIAEASKLRIETETIEKGWDYVKINVEYDYPVALEAVSLYLSEKEDMSDANIYECNVEGKKYSVDVDSLKAGVAYYYCYEYDNGYEKEKGGKKSMQTISKPVVVTKDITSITTTSATLNGSVTNNDAINEISEMGFCWDTKQNPTIEGSHYNNGGMSGTGTSGFSYNLTSLVDNKTYYVRTYVKTNFGIVYGEEKSFTTVEIVLPTVTTNTVTNITTNSASCGGNVTFDGNSTVTARGICWSTSPNPTVEDNKTNNGSGTGSFTSYMSGLKDGTTYYVRAYATNEKGTSYGEEKTFTTVEIVLPTVATNSVTNIKMTTATCGGNVMSDGNSTVTARGICWSTSPNPTIEKDNKINNGSGTGSFTSYMSGLQDGTTYYVRAYATNEKGTAYGEEKSFTTLELLLPTVMTENITNIKTNSARSGGNVSSDGNGTVTARGICWSTKPNPTISDSKTTDGSGTGSYTSNLSNLASQTTYYVRAYATNEKGTAYGEEKSFTTLELLLPTVTTNTVTNITTNSATCGGNVTFDGNATVTARGICWSTSPNPTIEKDNKINSSATGPFTSYMSGLKDGTTYYVRAYATNEKGTAYGEEKSFATLKKVLPTVTTNAVTNIKATTATCGGYVSSDVNATVTARGICWSTSPNPTINDNKIYNGSGTGSFTSYMSGLQDGTTYYVRAYATNENGTGYGEEKSFKTHQVIELPTVTTNYVTNITTNSATSGGNVTDDGNATVTARGVCWSTSQNPTINDNKTTDGSGTGSYTSNLSNLTQNTTYYVRAYATNEKGTSYGEQKSFTTVEIVLPTVTTNTVTNIKTTTATCGGNVTFNGNATVTARGICWSTSPNPTINDNKTTDGSGTGSYTSNLSNLTQNTTYYVRAYATNEKGTSYGEQKSFKTHQVIELPTVTTNNVTNITTNSATCGGNVTFDGNSAVTARGICWSTSQNPTIEDNKTTDGSGTGSFTSYMSGLKDGTTYYVRAYATNEKGTSYGEEKSFTTVEIILPTVTTNTVTNIKTTTATCGGNVTSDGNGIITARGICWSASQNPTIEDNKTTDGSGTGSFTSYMSGLKDGTTYYVRAYATNEKGTSYGEEMSFTTLELLLPTVTTTEVTNIKVTTATCGGIVTSDGNSMVTSRGICWNTSQNPTINDDKITDGSGIGNFTSNLSNLAPQTTYYVRAYATNEKGTSYGEQKSFTTLDKYNGHEYVDLGLPSGLLWATCNVGATSPEEYGNYYAWCETTTKSDYSISNCPTYGLSISQLQSQGYIDGAGNLNPKYDAAAANWGGSWRMPKSTELEELIDNCTWTWTTQNGVNGYNVEGPNGNSIFIPAAGYRSELPFNVDGSIGYYWSSTLYELRDDDAFYLYLHSGNSDVIYNSRYCGQSVRPVLE